MSATGDPRTWPLADSVYGIGEIEMALRRAGKGHVLGVNAGSQFNSWTGRPEITGTAAGIADDLDPAAWRRLSAGAGTKGERFHDWAYLEPADLGGDEYDERLRGFWTPGLLIRSHVADGEPAFFSTWCPAATPIETLVQVEGHRRAVEDSFETAENELGLDHTETRSRHGWRRHVLLVMLAFAMLAAIRCKANGSVPEKRRLTARAMSRRRSLVRAGHPPHRLSPGKTSHPSRPRHRMAALAPCPPSRRAAGPSDTNGGLH